MEKIDFEFVYAQIYLCFVIIMYVNNSLRNDFPQPDPVACHATLPSCQPNVQLGLEVSIDFVRVEQGQSFLFVYFSASLSAHGYTMSGT